MQFFQIQPNSLCTFSLEVHEAKAEFQIFNQTEVTNYVSSPIGGLRLKQIKHNDGVNDALVKNYTYTQATNPLASTGYLYIKPQYYGYNRNANGDLYGVTWSSNSVVPMANYSGYHIGYQRVVEEIVGGGKTEYLYNTQPVFLPTEISFPLAPLPFNVNDGTELKRTLLNTSETEISSTYYTSQGEYFTVLSGYFFKIHKFQWKETMNGPVETVLSASSYDPRTHAYRLAQVTNTLDGVSTVTQYSYDAQNRFLAPVGTMVTNSDEVIYNTSYKYAHDFTGAVFDSLKVRNIITPLETTQTVNGNQVDGNKIIYSLFGSNGIPSASIPTHPYPYQYQRYKRTWDLNEIITAGVWETEGTVDSIDTPTGFPKKFTLTGWQPERYTWDPINKIIKTKIFQNFTWTYDYTSNTRLVNKITDIDGQYKQYTYDDLLRLSTITEKLSNVQTTFTYSYNIVAGTPQNYVESKTTYFPVNGSGLVEKKFREYFDGLGRTVQKIGVKQSPGLNDVVNFFNYDAQGRLSKEYIPYESTNNNGAFNTTIPGTLPFVLNEYEASPLNRITKQTPPADATSWTGSITAYSSNTSADEVYMDDEYNQYPANSLSKMIYTDPDGKVTQKFSDKLGMTILTRKKDPSNASIKVDTYQHYDDKGRLKNVLPPGANSSNLGLIFQYFYDGEDKVIYKKVPDANGVDIKYNSQDLVALMKVPHVTNQWIGTKYDLTGRPTSTGLLISTTPDVNTFTIDPANLLTESKYDGNFFHTGTINSSPIYRGKLTGSKYKILGTTSDFNTSDFNMDSYGRITLKSATNHLYLNSSAETCNYSYDFADNLLTERRLHKPSSTISYQYNDSTTYDHWGRPIKHFIKDPGSASYFQNSLKSYNHRGFLTSLGLDYTTATPLQSLAYTYNNQGWLTGINTASSITNPTEFMMPQGIPNFTNISGTIFKLDIRYKDPLNGVNTFSNIYNNGNISQIWYQVYGKAQEGYGYDYDFLDRLRKSSHTASKGGTYAINNYQENIDYSDHRGNISSIFRTGMIYNGVNNSTMGIIDNLNFTLTPGTNKLSAIVENATDANLKVKGFNPGSGGSGYSYDASGNLISDSYKGISSIIYNHLNLPSQINFSDGLRKIEFTYDALGKQLKKKVITNSTTFTTQDYIDGIEYTSSNNTNTPKVEAIFNSEGRIFNTSTTSTPVWRKEYTIRDHLGNTRIVFTPGSAGTVSILQENHYYPFGLTMEGPWMNNGSPDDSKFLFNGNEFSGDFGVNWYNYGSRFYDPCIGRWTIGDPMAELNYMHNPYNFVKNNPILRIDPFGLWDIKVHSFTDRSKYPYGIAVLTNRKGEEVFRFMVRLQGTGGSNRRSKNADTPLGVYEIPDKYQDMWLSGKSRGSYGPNPRLVLKPESGEILESERVDIRLHGGKQEVYNEETSQYEKKEIMKLLKTNGCLRCFDYDIKTLRDLVFDLMNNDSDEYGGKLTIVEDLEEIRNTTTIGPVPGNIEGYFIPGERKQTWNDFSRWFSKYFQVPSK